MNLSAIGSRLKGAAKSAVFPVAAILAALLLTGIMLSLMGFDMLSAYDNLFSGSILTHRARVETLVSATPLIFSALSFAVAKQCGIFNIGAEGQLYIGAICTILVGSQPGWPAFIQLPLTLAAGFLGGAAWGMLVAALKIRFGANELITTIMFNYVAAILVNYCVTGPMKAYSESNTPQSEAVAESARLPVLLSGTRLHAGFILALAAVFLYWVFIWKSKKGYEFRVTGLNPNAAKYAGIPTSRNALLAMFLAGGLAGLAGCVELMGVQSRLVSGFAGSVGFDGVAAALLGNCNPVGLVLSSVLFGALNTGSNKMQMLADVPSAITFMMQGIIMLAMVSRGLMEGGGGLFKKKGGVRAK